MYYLFSILIFVRFTEAVLHHECKLDKGRVRGEKRKHGHGVSVVVLRVIVVS